MKSKPASSIVSLLIVSAAAAAWLGAAPRSAAGDETRPPTYRQEGRAAEPVPAGQGASLAPAPGAVPALGAGGSKFGGVVYEPNRIKRTPPLDPTESLDGKWDVLYRYIDTLNGDDGPGGSGTRTVYFDWDDDYLYFAMETPKPTDVRFEIDARDDGWLHGADNLSIQVSCPAEGATEPAVLAQRFDTAQNRDRPVYAEASIPASAMRARAGTTPSGSYGVTLALPRTETIGLERKPGATFGLRVETGLLPAQVGAVDSLTFHPMLRLTLADTVEAVTGGLQLRVLVLGGRQKNPGDDVRFSLEAKNASKRPIELSSLYLRGSLATQPLLDSGNYRGVTVEPGKTFKRDVRSPFPAAAGTGSYVVAGGAETADGATVSAMASFDRLEPYVLGFKLDETPVDPRDAPAPKKPAKGKKAAKPAKPEPDGVVRVAVASVLSRVYHKDSAIIRLDLPDGWKLVDGEEGTATIGLHGGGNVEAHYFHIVVPRRARAGVYPITATLGVDGRQYVQKQAVRVKSVARREAEE